MRSTLLYYLGFAFSYKFLSICSPWNPQNAMKMYAWRTSDIELPVVSWNCVVFCLVAKDCWGKLDLCWAGADQTPRGRQKHCHQHCVCPDPLWGEQAVTPRPLPWSYLIHAIPVIYEPYFCIFTCAFCVLGSFFLMAFQMPSERYEALLCQRVRATTLGHIFRDKISLVLSPEGWGLCFWEHPKRFSAEPNPFTFLSSFSGF